MSEVKTPPVPATPVDDIDVDGMPGAIEIADDGSGLWYLCPCGCGHEGYLRFRTDGGPRPSWIWDGNRDKPTLKPSVHHVGHWHGWLKAGVWVSC